MTRKAQRVRLKSPAAPDKSLRGDLDLALATRVAHAGTSASGGSAFGPLSELGETSHGLPIFQTAKFCYPDAAAADRAATGVGYLYSRHGNPTVNAFESAMADLEGADAGLGFASGMGATAATLFALADGGEVLMSEGIYGGSIELARDLGPRHGFTTRFVAGWNNDAVGAALTPKTRVLMVETLTNPLLRISDLPSLAKLCWARGVLLVVDSTFASPHLCRPIEHGADVVIHSVSKYVGGHGDLIGGVVLGPHKLVDRVRRYRTLLGASMDPFTAWLSARGLRTLSVRMNKACENALGLAYALGKMRGVLRVVYPGLDTHPDHLRARYLLEAPGAIVTFELKDGKAARRFYDRVRVIGRAASLGDVSSVLTHPATFSHKGLPPAERKRTGITDGLLRLSVGLEDARDLVADVIQALAGAR